jgi:hypothetical protein
VDSAFSPRHNHARGGNWKQFRYNCEKIARAHPELIRPEKISSEEREYGRQSDYFRVSCLGLPPLADPCSIIPDDAVLAAMRWNELIPQTNTLTPGTLVVIAMDLARQGGDEAVIAVRVNNRLVLLQGFQRTEPTHIAAAAINLAEHMGLDDGIEPGSYPRARAVYVFDAVGMGQTLYEYFYSRGKNAQGFVGNATAVTDSSLYHDRNAEAYYLFRRGLLEGHNGPILLRDEKMRYQLTNRYGGVDKAGELIVEDKEKYRRRAGGSPDRADAVVMAFAPLLEPGRVSTARDVQRSQEIVQDGMARAQATLNPVLFSPGAGRMPGLGSR